MRLIKKYGNRKLYDTGSGNYINYNDLFRLVSEGHDIKVVRFPGNEDITAVQKHALAARALRSKPELWESLIKSFNSPVA